MRPKHTNESLHDTNAAFLRRGSSLSGVILCFRRQGSLVLCALTMLSTLLVVRSLARAIGSLEPQAVDSFASTSNRLK